MLSSRSVVLLFLRSLSYGDIPMSSTLQSACSSAHNIRTVEIPVSPCSSRSKIDPTLIFGRAHWAYKIKLASLCAHDVIQFPVGSIECIAPHEVKMGKSHIRNYRTYLKCHDFDARIPSSCSPVCSCATALVSEHTRGLYTRANACAARILSIQYPTFNHLATPSPSLHTTPYL